MRFEATRTREFVVRYAAFQVRGGLGDEESGWWKEESVEDQIGLGLGSAPGLLCTLGYRRERRGDEGWRIPSARVRANSRH